MTVQLLFEPAGRPSEDRQYYLKQKENICVVCGTEESCIRKNIVPHEYRKYVAPVLPCYNLIFHGLPFSFF